MINDPEYPWTTKGPEHETMALVGSNCGVGDLKDIFRANYLCNELGMDTITAGATISCAMELFETGFLARRISDTRSLWMLPICFAPCERRRCARDSATSLQREARQWLRNMAGQSFHGR